MNVTVKALGTARDFTGDFCEITGNAIGPKRIQVVPRPKRAYFFWHTHITESESKDDEQIEPGDYRIIKSNSLTRSHGGKAPADCALLLVPEEYNR